MGRVAELESFAIGNGTRAKGSTRISDEVMRLQPSTQMAMDWTVTIISNGPHPWDQWNPRSKARDLLNHGSHGFHGSKGGSNPEGRHSEANHTVEANRRPDAPLEAGSPFRSRFCAPTDLPAAVAHLGRSAMITHRTK